MLSLKEHPFLIDTLCAILMILPQGKTSNTLKNRIEISRLMLRDVGLGRSVEMEEAREFEDSRGLDVEKLMK
jgi:hypothetical protein